MTKTYINFRDGYRINPIILNHFAIIKVFPFRKEHFCYIFLLNLNNVDLVIFQINIY